MRAGADLAVLRYLRVRPRRRSRRQQAERAELTIGIAIAQSLLPLAAALRSRTMTIKPEQPPSIGRKLFPRDTERLFGELRRPILLDRKRIIRPDHQPLPAHLGGQVFQCLAVV